MGIAGRFPEEKIDSVTHAPNLWAMGRRVQPVDSSPYGQIRSATLFAKGRLSQGVQVDSHARAFNRPNYCFLHTRTFSGYMEQYEVRYVDIPTMMPTTDFDPGESESSYRRKPKAGSKPVYCLRIYDDNIERYFGGPGRESVLWLCRK
jgi:hypothetical protein